MPQPLRSSLAEGMQGRFFPRLWGQLQAQGAETSPQWASHQVVGTRGQTAGKGEPARARPRCSRTLVSVSGQEVGRGQDGEWEA